MTSRDKKMFSILGEVKLVDGWKQFVPKSPEHLHAVIARLPVGKQLLCTYSERLPTRSEEQLNYFFVLVEYLCEYTGFTKNDMYQILIKDCFGVEKRVFLGKVHEVRRSISEAARMPKSEMAELITYTLECCRKLDINVPTPEELGYISNYRSYRSPMTPVLKQKVERY